MTRNEVGFVRTMVCLLALGTIATNVLADHTEPAKAGAKFGLVNAFAECSSPNTQVQATSLYTACAPPFPESNLSQCFLTPKGSGTLNARATGSVTKGTQDIILSANVHGLNSLCEGHELCIELSFRSTSDDCAEGSCTMVDVQNAKATDACCTVTNGACKIQTTLLTSYFAGFFEKGKNTGIEIMGCGLAPQAPLIAEALKCGVVLK